MWMARKRVEDETSPNTSLQLDFLASHLSRVAFESATRSARSQDNWNLNWPPCLKSIGAMCDGGTCRSLSTPPSSWQLDLPLRSGLTHSAQLASPWFSGRFPACGCGIEVWTVSRPNALLRLGGRR